MRIKKDIKQLENTLNNILKFEVVEFEWNTNINPKLYEHFKNKDRLKSLGFIAQDIKQYYPEIVNYEKDGYYSLDYKKLNSVLVESIKEQQLFIEDIQEKIKKLETELF